MLPSPPSLAAPVGGAIGAHLSSLGWLLGTRLGQLPSVFRLMVVPPGLFVPARIVLVADGMDLELCVRLRCEGPIGNKKKSGSPG